MGRKGIQVDEEIFNAVKLMYPDMSWSSILRLLLEPKGLPKDEPKDYIASTDDSLYASKEDLKALKDKFSKVLARLIDVNKLKR
jgi:predicted CopG family antitoxin